MNPQDVIDEAHSDRPNPDEPWRYACLGCGSTRIAVLVASQRRRRADYPFGGPGGAMAREHEAERYRCESCGDRYRSVIDKRTGGATSSTPKP